MAKELSDKQKAREDVQASYFCVRLYVDTVDYDIAEVLAKITSFDEWGYCLHDRDVKNDGTPDKEHYHAVFRNLTESGDVSPTTIGAVAKVLGIDSSNVQAGRNENENRGFKGSFRYLIHDTAQAKNDGKFQYSKDDITSNLDLDRIFGESFDMAKKIMDYILTSRPGSFTALCKWCIDNGCWKEFRRSQYAFRTIMDEVKRNEV